MPICMHTYVSRCFSRIYPTKKQPAPAGASSATASQRGEGAESDPPARIRVAALQHSADVLLTTGAISRDHDSCAVSKAWRSRPGRPGGPVDMS